MKLIFERLIYIPKNTREHFLFKEEVELGRQKISSIKVDERDPIAQCCIM